MTTRPATHAFDYRRYGPARTPDWRWRIAVRHVRRRTRPEPWEDSLIAKIVQFLRHDPIKPAGEDDSFPSDMAAASSIHSAAGPLRDEMEARLLAGQSFETIAATTGISAGVISAFEAAFFSVAFSLNSTEWIQSKAIRLRPGEPVSEGQAWKAIGYHCGTAVLEHVIGGFHRRSAATEVARLTVGPNAIA